MEQSILTSTKKVLNIADEETAFDHDVLTHINSAFFDLHQLGIGPDSGFVIDDESPVWTNFVAGPVHLVSAVKTNVYLRVRMLFDPPTMPHVLAAMERQIEQSDWRLNVMRESTEWVDPDPPVVLAEEEV